jgi:hypothetical protein
MTAVRTFTLDEDLGSLDDPKGSAPWARAMRYELHKQWHDGTTELQRFQRYLALMEREKGYQQLDDRYGHPFPSMRAFCVAKPPDGLGFDPDLLDAIARETRQMTLGELTAEVQALGEHGGDRKSEGYQGNDSNLDQRGNSSRYHIARLKRDYPDIAEALARGEYPSVRAAAKAAGLVREPTPLATLRRAWQKASPEERQQFRAEVLDPPTLS